MEKQPEHNQENCWFDNQKKEFVPLANMTYEHLRNARKYAQKREAALMKEAWKFTDKIEILDAEAERRGITLPDYRCKFQKNKKVLQNAIKKEHTDVSIPKTV